MNKRGLDPMKLGEAYSIMVMKSPARDGSLAVLQLAVAPRDDEASGVGFSLVSNSNGSLEIVSGCSLLLDGGFGAYVGGSSRWL